MKSDVLAKKPITDRNRRVMVKDFFEQKQLIRKFDLNVKKRWLVERIFVQDWPTCITPGQVLNVFDGASLFLGVILPKHNFLLVDLLLLVEENLPDRNHSAIVSLVDS